MSQDFANIKPIQPINLIDTSILVEIAHDAKLSIPKNEVHLITKSRELSNDLVRAAQERNKRWRENIVRSRNRRKKFAKVREFIRTDQDLADRKMKEKRIEKVQAQIVHARNETKEKIIEKAKERKILLKRRQDHYNERREELENRFSIQTKRAEKRKEDEPTPKEVRNKLKAEIAAVIAQLRKRIAKQREARSELIEETIVTRNEATREYRQLQQDRVNTVHEQEKIQRARIEENNSYVRSPEERRHVQTEEINYIFDKRDKTYAENQIPATKHFGRLERNIERILERAVTYRKRAREHLKEIIRRARDSSTGNMLASGNPAAQAKFLSNVEVHQKIREFIEAIITHANESQDERSTYMTQNKEKARERIARYMVASGNPKEIFRNLGAAELFRQRMQRDVFTILENAAKRRASDDTAVTLSPDAHTELYRAIARMLARINASRVNIKAFDYTIIGLARRNPSLITRALVEKVMAKIMQLEKAAFFVRSVKNIFERDQKPRFIKPIGQYHPTLQRAALQTLANIVPYDATDNVITILQNNYASLLQQSLPFERSMFLLEFLVSMMQNRIDFEERYSPLPPKTTTLDDEKIDQAVEHNNVQSVLNSFIPHKVSTADHIIQEQTPHKDNESPSTVPLPTLMSLIPDEIPRLHESDEIITLLETPLAYFDSLGKEIKVSTGEDIFPREKTLEGLSDEEKRLQETEREDKRKEKLHKKTEAEKLQARREQLLKCIEEQNLTAHEKVNNERNLLDLFF